ncbi:hypothetical protein CW357_06410 [Rummeliibacillus sp. TYF005]|nr:hypothetical protein D1606_05005 [Rummeliibacillus sp. POC4]RPJ96151.1 hypothetical protein CW357_06410 [Rummeliibacillus sp. TYF005]
MRIELFLKLLLSDLNCQEKLNFGYLFIEFIFGSIFLRLELSGTWIQFVFAWIESETTWITLNFPWIGSYFPWIGPKYS